MVLGRVLLVLGGLGGDYLRDIDHLFNLDLYFILLVLEDFLVEGEWSVGEEILNGDVVVDAEQVAGRKGIPKI